MLAKKPVVHLFIPHLLQPLSLWQKDYLFHAESPSLSLLLRAYEKNYIHKKQGLESCLFASLGLADKELPWAYYRYQDSTYSKPEMYKKRGGVSHNNQTATLLCADPVHLEVGMNDITLTDIVTDLSDTEAMQLINELNSHFKQDNLEFLLDINQQWYLSLPSMELVNTTAVNDVLRQNIAHYLPSSKERNWQLISTEAQMILHASSINQQRETQGLPTANSLWFWGGGSAPEIVKHNVKRVYGQDEEQGKVFAKAAGCDWHVLTHDKQSSIEVVEGVTAVILDQLSLPAIFDRIDDYQQVLSKIDENIVKPLMEKWQIGEIELLIDSCDGNIITPLKVPWWKLWANKPKPLIEVVR